MTGHDRASDVVELLARAICGKNCDMPKCSCQPANSRADCRLLSMRQASAALSALDAAGLAVVPREATADMCGEAGSVSDRPIAGYMARLWDAFLAAAPKAAGIPAIEVK